MLLAGCSLPTGDLAPKTTQSGAVSTALAHNICVDVGAPGDEAFNLAYGVTRKQLAAALSKTLAQNGLLGTTPSCGYVLTGNITHLSGPPLALPFVPETFHASIHYRVTAKPAGDAVFDRVFSNTYDKSYVFIPFAGAIPTERQGEEGVMQRNIGVFDQALQASYIGGQPTD